MFAVGKRSSGYVEFAYVLDTCCLRCLLISRINPCTADPGCRLRPKLTNICKDNNLIYISN